MEELIRKETLTLQACNLKHTHTNTATHTQPFAFYLKVKNHNPLFATSNAKRNSSIISYTSEMIKGMFCVLKAGDMEEDAIFFKNRLDELNHKYINLEETVVLSLSA